MSASSTDTLRAIFDQTVNVHQRYMTYGLDGIVIAASTISRALASGRKVLAFGNGGSASDAEHLIAELVGRFEGERRALAGLALTADSSVLTAIGNDYGYEKLFARQVQAVGKAGDVFFGISTSGKSPNILRALEECRSKGITTVGFTGQSGGAMLALCDYCVRVPSTETPKIQEGHITLGHIVCGLVEREMFTPPKS